MCASCGCGCKTGKAAKGCKCTCKTCRDARTMSVEKSYIVAKAARGFEALADAILDDVYEDEFASEDDVEKGLPSALRAAGKGLESGPKVPFGPGQTYISNRVAAAQAGKPANKYLKDPAMSHIGEKWKASGTSDRLRSRQTLDSMTNGGKGKIDPNNRLGQMAEKRKALQANRTKPKIADSNRPAW